MQAVFVGAFVVLLVATHAVAQTETKKSEPVQSELRILQGHSKTVTTFAWAADARTFATASDDRSIRIWDSERDQPIALISDIAREGFGGPVVAFDRDLKVAAINYWGEITLRNVPDGAVRLKIDPILDRGQKSAFRPDVFSMAFSPDGKRLATAGSVAAVGGRHGLPGGIVIIWDVEQGKLLQKSDVLSTAPSCIAWDATGSSYAAGTNGAGGELPEPGEVLLWDAMTGETKQRFKVQPEVEPGEWASAADVAFHPQGSKVSVVVKSGSRSTPAGLLIKEAGAYVQTWDLQTGKATELVPKAKGAISCVDFSPDGRYMAFAEGDQIFRIWDVTAAKEVQAVQSPSRITALQFSPDGKLLGLGCRDGTVLVWMLQMR